jgi:hypothetical protein
MRLLAFVGFGAFLLVGATLGLRLLAMARRGRRVPETLLGLALVALCLPGYPLLVAARAFERTQPLLAQVLATTGNLGVAACAVLVAAFTCRVFHPGQGLARRAVAVLGALEVLLVVQLALARHRALSAGADSFAVMDAVTPWVLPFLLLLATSFGWAGVEAARHVLLLRRRGAGRGTEPGAVRCFRLWAASMLSAAALVLVLSVVRLTGARVSEHPASILLAAVTGLTLSVSWYLAVRPVRLEGVGAPGSGAGETATG